MSTKTGLAGEYLTAAVILEQEGWQVSMAQQDGIDLVAFKDGKFVTVQVKTATLRTPTDRCTPSYHFNLASGRHQKIVKRGVYDILACCAATDRRVWFQAQCCVNQLTMRKSSAFFSKPDLEADTWQRAVQIVMEGRR
jgi:hypothetical protein